MDAADPADLAGQALFVRAVADLGRGAWQPDIAELDAALAAASSAPVKAQLANLLAHHHFTRNALHPALLACRTWIEHAPGETAAKDSLISIYLRLGQYGDAITAAEARLAAEPANFKLRSALSNACSRQGDLTAAKRHGTACLELADRMTTGIEPWPLPGPPPPFDPGATARNVIAFSLFGSADKYLNGAIRNALAARFLYPEWTCRFYIDASVSQRCRDRLKAEGAQVQLITGMPAARYGTFWRFLAADDPAVDRYLLRDCDACLNLRERAAVEDWIASGQPFHLMRDGFTHTDLVLAGMWGGVRGALPPMLPAVTDFCATAPFSRAADQAFLRERVWPHLRGRVLAHDACFTALGAVPFPPRADIPGPRVGQAVTAPKIA